MKKYLVAYTYNEYFGLPSNHITRFGGVEAVEIEAYSAQQAKDLVERAIREHYEDPGEVIAVSRLDDREV